METVYQIKGSTAEEVWARIANDFAGQDILEYDAVIQQDNQPSVLFEIEIDPGGGFEGGFEWTRFSAPVTVKNDFRFALHHEGFLDKAGKLIGMEDKSIGYPEFDKEFIIKTNDEAQVKELFAEQSVRNFFITLKDFNLHITRHSDSDPMLELEFEQAITNTEELKAIYKAFIQVLQHIHQ